MVDYCAVEYINTTLKMKIRMIDYKGGQKLSKVQEKVKERRKKQKSVLPLFTKKQQQLFFLKDD